MIFHCSDEYEASLVDLLGYHESFELRIDSPNGTILKMLNASVIEINSSNKSYPGIRFTIMGNVIEILNPILIERTIKNEFYKINKGAFPSDIVGYNKKIIERFKL